MNSLQALKITCITLLFCGCTRTYASLSFYEKLISHKIVTIVLKQEQNSLETIDLKKHGITYLQSVDEQKRQEMLEYIEQKIVKGTEINAIKVEKSLQVTKGEKESNIKKITKVEKETREGEVVLPAIKVEKEQKKLENHNAFTRAKAVAIETTGKTLDYTKIQQAWMGWINELRVARSLDPLHYDTRLEYSADAWNKVMIARDQRSHQRDIGDSFYNYKKIEQRFKNLGLEFINTKRTTFVENVGVRRGWKCTAEECSDQVIKELRGIFDYYLAEEGTKHDAHFKSMINPYFKVGGLAFDISSSNKLYFTVHYGTEIQEKP